MRNVTDKDCREDQSADFMLGILFSLSPSTGKWKKLNFPLEQAMKAQGDLLFL
jgi:hypothetical protein